MAIAFRGASHNASASNADIAVTVASPSGLSSGDYMIAGVTVPRVQTSITPPSGWTLLLQGEDLDNSGAGPTGTVLRVYGKVASGSEPTSYTWAWTELGGAIAIVAYSGVDITTPIVVNESALISQGANSTTKTSPSITTGGNRWLVGVFADTHGSTWTSTSSLRVTRNRTNAASICIEDSGSNIPLGTVTRTATASISSNRGVNAIIALLPAGTAPETGLATTILANTAAGGTPGATIANTAGQAAGSGTLFNEVYVAPGSTLRYSADAPPGHTRSYVMQGSGIISLTWGATLSALGPVTTVALEFWLKVPDVLPTTSLTIVRAYTAVDTTSYDWHILYTADGKIALQNRSFIQVITCPAPLVSGTWYRVEAYLVSGVSAKIKVSQGASQTTYTQGSVNAFTAVATRSIRYSLPSGQADMGEVLFGPIRIGTGPDYFTPTVVGNERPQANAGGNQQAVEPGQLTYLQGSSSDADGTIVGHTWRRLSGQGGVIAGSGAERAYRPAGTVTGYTEQFGYQTTDNSGGISDESTVQHSILPSSKITSVGGVDVAIITWVEKA